MTRVSFSGSKEVFTGEYVDPSIASYVYYPCEYCGDNFQLVEPDNNFQAGGAIRKFQYRNPDTNEIKAIEKEQGPGRMSCLCERDNEKAAAIKRKR
jgi:hypothetical protein